MSRKWFTSDFHIGMSDLLSFEKTPFKTIEQHDKALIRSCKERAKPGDIIYHLGDFASFRSDRGHPGLDVKPAEILKDIPAMFLNIRGNHDFNNKVKSICDSMHMHLSRRYPSVALSHYPSYDRRIDASCLTAPIVLHGHVHSKFKHCLDLDHHILNVNVGCMVWGWKIISEDELVAYLNSLFKKKPDELFRCKTNANNHIEFLQPS